MVVDMIYLLAKSRVCCCTARALPPRPPRARRTVRAYTFSVVHSLLLELTQLSGLSQWEMDTQRVRISKGGKEVLLKSIDLSVQRLSSIFKVSRYPVLISMHYIADTEARAIQLFRCFFLQMKPENLYIADEITDMAEFPDSSGNFNVTGGRYEVFGDQLPEHDTRALGSSSSTANWSIPSTWSGSGPQGNPGRGSTRTGGASMSPSFRLASGTGATSAPSIKKTIPYVKLHLEVSTGKVGIESIEENLYVKIPQSIISVKSILEEASRQLCLRCNNVDNMHSSGSSEVSQGTLCLLDTKFVKLCDNIPKGTAGYYVVHYYYYYYTFIIIDIDFWNGRHGT